MGSFLLRDPSNPGEETFAFRGTKKRTTGNRTIFSPAFSPPSKRPCESSEARLWASYKSLKNLNDWTPFGLINRLGRQGSSLRVSSRAGNNSLIDLRPTPCSGGVGRSSLKSLSYFFVFTASYPVPLGYRCCAFLLLEVSFLPSFVGVLHVSCSSPAFRRLSAPSLRSPHSSCSES